jgi:hypothetical protein
VAGAVVSTGLTWWREKENRKALAQDWINQQRWQRKADAYTQIIEALWQRREYAREYEESLYAHVSTGPTIKSEKYRDMETNRTNLRRVADVRAFVISDDVAESLKRYFKRDAEIMAMIDEPDQDDADLKSTEECLSAVGAAALRDLNVGHSTGNRLPRPLCPQYSPTHRRLSQTTGM